MSDDIKRLTKLFPNVKIISNVTKESTEVNVLINEWEDWYDLEIDIKKDEDINTYDGYIWNVTKDEDGNLYCTTYVK